MNPEFELEITDLSHDGRGVARHDGKAVFVSGALRGERVRARRTRRHRQYDEAETLEVLSAAPERVAPRCAHFGVCAGCVLQHLDPAAQIAAKQHTLLENLERIGAVHPERVLPALTGEVWGYRRRARLSVRRVDKKNRTLVGFREANGRYVAEVSRCEVLHPAVGTRIGELAELIESLDARHAIPQIEVAIGDADAALVLRHLQPLGESDRARLAAFAERTGLVLLLQPGGVDSVETLRPPARPLSFRLPAYALDIAFEPLDFVQVNAAINERMIEHALALLDPEPGERVLDLFCGLGNFTLPLALRAARVSGVEGDAGLIARARANAERNAIANVEYHVADLAQDQRQAPWSKAVHELLLLDPPRAGAAAVLEYLPGPGTRRVVYVSCHPGSLARDAGTLVHRHGFALRAAGVMDMFPHTAHVESIALFER
jgi:23S rRNA (uracil1939-C5)-methyltransferase